jgi:Transposase
MPGVQGSGPACSQSLHPDADGSPVEWLPGHVAARRPEVLLTQGHLLTWHVHPRLPGVASPWARRTPRLLAIGIALGGAAGVRLRRPFGLTVSRNTLLRVIRRTPCPAIASLQILSVDDFALRRRHTYDTLLVDLARRRPLALLPDREAATVAQWLQAHPWIEVIVRDRAAVYEETARTGAPTVCQVADRFHLLQNLADTLTQACTAHAPELAQLKAQCMAAPTPMQNPTSPAADPAPAGPARTMAETRRHKRPPALSALCRRAPGGHGRRRGGGDAALEPGTDRRAHQPPEDAEGPDGRLGTARSAGATLPPGGLTGQGSLTTSRPLRPASPKPILMAKSYTH